MLIVTSFYLIFIVRSQDWRINGLGKINSTFIQFLNKAERLALSTDDESWLAFDPSAASILLDPSIVTSTRNAWVEVENVGRISRGAMIVDHDAKKANVKIVARLDHAKLQNMLESYLSD